MTVYLVYYDTARVGRRWLHHTRGHYAGGSRDHATRFLTRREAEAALRAARRHAAGIETANDQHRSTDDAYTAHA